MLRRHTLRATGALLFITVACHDPVSPQDNLEAARRRWSANGPASYQVTVSRSCECFPDMSQPVIVTVTNGQVTSRVYTATGQTVSVSSAALYPDVNGLFEKIADAIGQRADRLEVVYHPSFGYPIEILVDYREGVADDEISYTASAFIAK